MKKKLLIKIVSYILSVCLAMPITVLAYTASDEENKSEVVAFREYSLSESVTFKEEFIVDENSNAQRGFVLEASAENVLNSVGFLNGKNLNTRTYITNLVKDNQYEQGSIVAAVNGDFFNLSTGLAESCVITDGVLLTSDRDNYAFAFDKDGKAFIAKPAFNIPLVTPYGQYTILHYNKEFTEYGLYLYSDCYGEKTRIGNPSYEIVLTTYSAKLNYEQMAALIYGEAGVPFDLVLSRTLEEGSEEIYINERYKEEIDTYAFENGYILNGLNFYMLCDATALPGETVTAYVSEIRDNPEGASLDIPKGSFILCANRETQIHKVEKLKVMDDVSFTFNCDERFIGVSDAIGCGALIVQEGKAVENTSQAHYTAPNPRTAIGIREDGSVVVFAVDGRQSRYSKGLTLKQLSYEMLRLGCVYAANLDGGGSTIVKASLPESFSFDTVSSPSEGEERKISNAVGFYNNHQPLGDVAYSYLNPSEYLVLSNGAVSLGKAVFTDSNHYGVDTSEKQVNKRENNTMESKEAVTDDTILKELLDISSAIDEQTEVTDSTYNYLGFTYSVDEKMGVIENGKYKPMGYSGFAPVISHSPDGKTNTAFTFRAVDKVDKIEIEGLNPTMYVGDTADASAFAFYKDYKASGQDSCFEWKASDEQSFTVDKDGVLTALNGNDKAKLIVSYGETSEEYDFEIRNLPFNDIEKNWAKHNIIKMYDRGISIGELTELGRLYFPARTFTRSEFCVMLARHLGLTKAVDTVKGDTSEETVVEIVAVEGEKEISDSQETNVFENTEVIALEAVENKTQELTESELASSDVQDSVSEIVGAEPAERPEEEQNIEAVTDTVIPEYADLDTIPVWAIESVEKLYEKGYLDGFEHVDEKGNKIFDGTANVTRREVIRLIGIFLEDAPADVEIMLSDISENDIDFISIQKAVHGGIFKGYVDGTLRPDNYLTRAEVSAIFVRLLDLI